MSGSQVDALCDVPEDVVAQLLSNIRNAANQRSRAVNARDERDPVRNSQDTVVLPGEAGTGHAAQVDEDSSSSSGEEEGGESDEERSWPVATWQHQVSLPKSASAGIMNQLSSGKTALASEKAFCSKVVGIFLLMT